MRTAKIGVVIYLHAYPLFYLRAQHAVRHLDTKLSSIFELILDQAAPMPSARLPSNAPAPYLSSFSRAIAHIVSILDGSGQFHDYTSSTQNSWKSPPASNHPCVLRARCIMSPSCSKMVLVMSSRKSAHSETLPSHAASSQVSPSCRLFSPREVNREGASGIPRDDVQVLEPVIIQNRTV